MSKYAKKRKALDEDTSEEGQRHRSRRARSESRSESPEEKKPRKKEDKGGSKDEAESISIEETNRIRAELGLAPLIDDSAPSEPKEAEDGSAIINEDGMEFRHKKADNWAEKKRQEEIKEKLEASKKKRELMDKVMKTKKLADDSDDEEDAQAWVEKMREQERKKAEEREKTLNAMDEDFDGAVEKKKVKPKSKPKKKTEADTGGLVIGHSRDSFLEMRDQILVLEDKSVLDTGDETLINPNLIDNERHKKNVELRKRKDFKRGMDEDFDEFGNPIDRGVLAKYDEELEGYNRETFRLDDKGELDLDKEERERRIKSRLEIAGKTLVDMTMPKYKVASEFYTNEEMVAFRKPKKGKKEKSSRKRGKMLKADDLIPESGNNTGSRDRGSRAAKTEASEDGDVKMEVNEEEGDGQKGPWKKIVQAGVDVNQLKKLAATVNDDEDDSDEEEFGNSNLAGIIIDDDAHDELSSILDKTRKLKQTDVKPETDHIKRIHDLVTSQGVEDDDMDVDIKPSKEGMLLIDSTMEYCRNIGENLTYGLAGNRTDAIDMEELKKEDESSAALAKWKQENKEKEKRKKMKKEHEESKGGWTGPSTSSERLDSDDERELEEAREKLKGQEESDSDSEDEDGNKKKEYVNVLGKEADVTKGVGAMLKLAAQKGYLTDPNASRHSGQNLDHLRNRAKTQVEPAKYDIDEKHLKKLERLGTSGRGATVPFPEKRDYKPDVVIAYVDSKGRAMEQKDAYRELSYKFHGRMPGKRQTEKRMVQREKKEMLKQMNSSDTPLGTLTKQLKKQEQLQTPYLVLSGSGRNDHSSLKKE